MKTLKNIYRVLVFLLLIGGWSLAALSLHVVRTPDRVGLITKTRLGISDTYVDTRAWTLADAANHSDLVASLTRAGKLDLLNHLTPQNEKRAIGELLRTALESPTTRPG